MIIKKITVGEVKELLASGKTVKVKTLNNEYTKISNFVEKGVLDTYQVVLSNDLSIKVSREHKFFTNIGWIEARDIIPNKNSILCEDNKYYLVKSVNYIGKYKIVDITVEHSEHCYFGNGMLNHNTGKSLICAQIIAETQKRGGLAVFFDSERAVDRTFWTALGVNIRNVNYVPFNTLEEFFNKLEACIGAFRKNSKDRLLTIFVDSVAQASTDEEMESEHGVTGYNTGKSIIISKAMRKITGLISDQRILVVYTNQVRYNMNAGPFGDKWIVPGGKALPFACSVRLRLANLGKIKKSDSVIGMQCQAQVIKNRCGPNYRTAAFDIMFDSGIQDMSSWYEYLKENGLIKPVKKKDETEGEGKKKKTKAEEEEETKKCKNFSFTKSDGTDVEFTSAKFVELMNSDAGLKEEVYQTICNNYIMKYRDPNSQIVEDAERTDTENDDITAKAIKDE